MNGNLAVLLMGSKVDLEHAKKITAWLDHFGIAHETRIASAHKTPEKVLEILADNEKRGLDIVYIGIAGLSNALSGMVEFSTAFPVVSCPPPNDSFAGADIFSSLRMPPGVAAATVLDPRNAALFAAKIFALKDKDMKERVREYQKEQRDKIEADDAELQRRDGE
ncbi:MAG: 5-(carboxyamino)imidazole ribonucleotide mutase [Spirochaetota bacterium]